MYRVTEIIDFSYGHRLIHYKGRCAHLHGHNGRVEIEIAAEALDERSMVADFGDIGRIVREWIDENLDHRMLLNESDPLVAVFRQHDEPVFTMDRDPTAEEIARLIFEQAASRGLAVSRVRLWETPTSMACYSPQKH
jgi:6-pyruvoyltetrahydropterin/6-carboxytetrahydropterin synthase